MRIDVLTTFPEMFGKEPPAALGVSIPARARAAGIVDWHAHDIRAFAGNKHDKTDDRPFGGGPGMVMMCQPVWDAVAAAEALDERRARRVVLTPQGVRMGQGLVEELSREARLVLIAGHYEGIDERVIEKLEPLEVSVGDYVLSGGEMAALVLMDAVIRLLPGALGDGESASQDSFSAWHASGSAREAGGKRDRVGTADAGGKGGSRRLLDCAHYTRPREWMGMSVPEVLLSGDHQRIAAWREAQRLERTRARRPDLLG